MAERRVGHLGLAVGIEDWTIGLLHVDDTGTMRASLDSWSRDKQIEIKAKNYDALLVQARHIAGLHVGLIETG